MTIIGASLVITGELTSEEDLAIDGRVEGPVAVRGGTLTIGKLARVESDVRASRVVIHGVVNGAVSATERIELSASAVVAGSLSANRVVIEEGASFNGFHRYGPADDCRKGGAIQSPARDRMT